MQSTGTGHRRRRSWLLVTVALTVVVGLTTHVLGSGPLADLAGDMLYAVMVYAALAFVFPRASVLVVSLSALGICALIELFQLTGLPAVWGETFWPIRLVLGAGFDAVDLIAYAAGAGLAAASDLALTRRARASRRV
ncbi:ribosomal maturation YjgA family protein [Microbacterium sp.]|uniref:ribosomal maturation YjgA family protein n=1 Tax=Microbacterium sp. TaxID=51671 RepID=UPI002FE1200F